MADKIKPKEIVVRATTHPGDTRSNIPTAELESFARPEEKRPAIVRYPRNPDLDPQLVWKGKDEQDSHDLEVPAVPIYIQETIDPLALVEELRAESQGRQTEAQLGFFAPYTDLTFEEKVDFYRHPGKWSNRMILGDSLLVMTSLAEKEGLKGQVQTIYIDPPYGIKFGSNWQVSTRKRDVRDGNSDDLTRQPEQVRAYRDTWELGIHSYLAYLRDRLVAARELLTESGSVFVQIGDENLHLVRSVMDEVFGPDNAIALITYKKTTGSTGEFIGGVLDYILWYGRDRGVTKYRPLWLTKSVTGAGGGQYTRIEDAAGARRLATGSELTSGMAAGKFLRLDQLMSQAGGRQKGEGAASWFPVRHDDKTYLPNQQMRWKTNESGMARLAAARRLVGVGNTLTYVRYLEDFPAMPFSNL